MANRPQVRVFCHPVDLVDDLGGTLDDIAGVLPADCAGPAGVAVAAAYHSSRDYLPRNRRRVHHSPAGVAFASDVARYPGALPPLPPMPVCAGEDLLRATVEAAGERGMPMDAWVVYLHHDEAVPVSAEGRVVNSFGDVYPGALCPAAPVVAAYAEALTRDVAARRPGAIVAEGLHPQPFPHGFHHERMFGHSGGMRQFLLGLCFCVACAETACRAGVDVPALRQWVQETVDGTVGDQPLPGLAALDGLAGERNLGEYLRLRAEHTTALVARCAETAAGLGVGFTWLDATHAWAEPDATAEATGDPGWQIGCDLSAIARICDVVTASYAEAEDEAARQLDQVTVALGRRPDAALVRMLGSTDQDLRRLSARIADLVSREVGWVGLYHYGLAPVHPGEAVRRGATRPQRP